MRHTGARRERTSMTGGRDRPGLGGPAQQPDPPASVDPDRPVGGRNLPVAVVSGVGLAVAFIGSVVWHPAAFTVLIGLLCTVAYLEMGRVLAAQRLRIEVMVLLVATYVMLIGGYRARHTGQAIGLAVLFGGAIAWTLADPGRRDVVRTLAMTMLLGLWVGLLASFGVLLVTSPIGGATAVFAVVGGAAISDVFAYATGTIVGRRPIAPTISPKKTWEGLVGGLAAAAALAALVLPLVDEAFTPLAAASLATLAGLAGFVGDLAESMIKRDLGVKDLGAILPGHGGVLDRVDGILFALPVGYFAVELLL